MTNPSFYQGLCAVYTLLYGMSTRLLHAGSTNVNTGIDAVLALGFLHCDIQQHSTALYSTALLQPTAQNRRDLIVYNTPTAGSALDPTWGRVAFSRRRT